MPAARHASRSCFIALAVIAMIGRSANAASARSARVASRPSISGICMSISTQAYAPRFARAISTASRPLPAMSRSIPRTDSSSEATIWFASLSSASSTFTPWYSRSSGAAPRRAARGPAPVASMIASKNDEAVIGFGRKTLTPSSAQRASSSRPA